MRRDGSNVMAAARGDVARIGLLRGLGFRVWSGSRARVGVVADHSARQWCQRAGWPAGDALRTLLRSGTRKRQRGGAGGKRRGVKLIGGAHLSVALGGEKKGEGQVGWSRPVAGI